MRDLADVVKRTALNGGQHTVATAEIRQEVKRRGKNNIISTNGAGNTRSRRS
jgi:hypothetical protein